MGEYHNGNNPTNKTVHTTARPPASRAGTVVHGKSKSSRPFDLSGIDVDELHHVLLVVAEHGDAITFSLTSDGGALSTVVLATGVRHKTYANTPDQLLERWRDLLQAIYD